MVPLRGTYAVLDLEELACPWLELRQGTQVA